MHRELAQHRLAYFVLLVMLVAISIAFAAVWPHRDLERIVIVILGLGYLLWGIVTHLHAERLSRRIVAEYATVSLLAVVVLWLLTLQ
jgi:hypothetical protein